MGFQRESPGGLMGKANRGQTTVIQLFNRTCNEKRGLSPVVYSVAGAIVVLQTGFGSLCAHRFIQLVIQGILGAAVGLYLLG